jgi:hypothetical protein
MKNNSGRTLGFNVGLVHELTTDKVLRSTH